MCQLTPEVNDGSSKDRLSIGLLETLSSNGSETDNINYSLVGQTANIQLEDCTKYTGEIDINGFGTAWFADGSQYKGHWRNSLMDGNGELTTKTEVFNGQWKEGIKDGFGVLLEIATSIKTTGLWSNGDLQQVFSKVTE